MKQSMGDDTDALNAIAKAVIDHWSSERYEEAEPLFRQISPYIDPKHYNAPRFFTCFGLTLENLGKFEEAETLFRKAVAASDAPVDSTPKDSITEIYGLGEFLFRRQRYMEAINVLVPVIEMKGNARLLALLLMARIYHRMKKSAEFRKVAESIYLASPKGKYGSVDAVMAMVVANDC